MPAPEPMTADMLTEWVLPRSRGWLQIPHNLGSMGQGEHWVPLGWGKGGMGQSYNNGQNSSCWLHIHPGDSQASLWLKAAETRYKISLWWLICYTWIQVREPQGVVERAGLQPNEKKVYLIRKLFSSTNSLFQVEAWGFPLDKSSFSLNCFYSLSNFAST